MKKIILILLIVVIGVFFAMCGNKSEVQLVERSIDGVAAYLGYFDGEDIDLSEEQQVQNALAGKYFRDDQVSIYEFDPNSPTYEFWESQTDTCVGGFLILYDWTDPEEMTDYEYMQELEKIESIRFENE